MASLFYAGIYEDDAIEKGLDYLVKTAFPGRGMVGAGSAHYFYGQYYSVQAMYLAGGEWWSGMVAVHPHGALGPTERRGRMDGPPDRRCLRHFHGPDRSPDAQAIPPDLPEVITKTSFRISSAIAVILIPVTVANSQDTEAPRPTGTSIRVIDKSLLARTGDPVRIEDSRVLVFDGPPGLPSIIPSEEFLAVVTTPNTSRSTFLSHRNSSARSGDDAPITVPYLELVDGQRFPGTLRPSDTGEPVWRSAWLKDIRFDLDRISRLNLSEDGRAVPDAVDADVVVLANGDRIEGLVADIGFNVEIEVDRPDGETNSVMIPLDRIASISLVNPIEPGNGAMTWLRGGHRILSESIRILGDGYVSLMSPQVGGGTAEIPLDFLVATVVDANRVLPLATQDVVSLDPGPAGEIRSWIPEPKSFPGSSRLRCGSDPDGWTTSSGVRPSFKGWSIGHDPGEAHGDRLRPLDFPGP